MFYIGVLLIFMGFSPVSHYVDDLIYVRNQPSYNYNDYYYDDDFEDDLFGSDHHGNDVSIYQTNYNYEPGYEGTYTPTGVGSAIFGLILIGFGSYLVYKNWKKPHNPSGFWRVMAVIIILYGLFKVLSDSLVVGNFVFTSIPGRVIVALRYLIPGLLIYFYNRKEEEPVVEETELIEEEPVDKVPNTPIERLVHKLEEAKETEYSKSNLELEKNLDNSINILNEIHRSDYNIDEEFLEQIAYLTDTYLEINNNKIKNQRSREVLFNIANTYGIIDEALENIYDSNFDEKANEIESDITTFQTKLSLEGKLDSPFEKFKENYQNLDD